MSVINRKYSALFIEPFFLIAGIVLIFYIQFSVSMLFGADGYLHIRMAEFLTERGFDRSFPWTQFSVFLDRFSDKDFLFHVILVPFTWFRDIFWGAKLAAATLFSLLFAIYYIFLRKWGERRFVPLFLILFFASPHFLMSLSRPRPFPLVLMFSILAVYLLSEKRPVWLFVLSFLYSLTHISAPVMLGYLVVAEGVRYFTERKISVRNCVGVTLGLAGGLLIHPYFPNNLFVFYLNGVMVPLFAASTGVLELGAEFFPAQTRDVLLNYFPLFLGLAGVMGVFSVCWRREGEKRRRRGQRSEISDQ